MRKRGKQPSEGGKAIQREGHVAPLPLASFTKRTWKEGKKGKGGKGGGRRDLKKPSVVGPFDDPRQETLVLCKEVLKPHACRVGEEVIIARQETFEHFIHIVAKEGE